MRINFRQGLVSYTVDGTGAPQFLLPGQGNGQALATVTLSVSPNPVTATFAHGSSNYLQTFDTSVPNAWGPLATITPTYLYWDIDLLTGNVTYGSTILEPAVSVLEPANPEQGQMWFDQTTTKMKVWNGTANAWVERARVLAGIVEGNNITQFQVGSQVGLTGDFVTGYLMYDSQLRPLRTSTNELLTTDTPVRVKTTVGTSGVLATPPNAFLPVKAGENIPAMSLVYFSAPDTVMLASSNPAYINQRTPVGIIQERLAATEIGNVTQSGEITYDQWDWPDSIGKAVYGDTTGQLTTIRPGGVLVFRVGTVKNRNTIVFAIDAETSPTVYTPSANDVLIAGNLPITTNDVINELGERVVTINLIPATPTETGGMSAADKALLDSYGPRFVVDETLLANKTDIGHTHIEADVIGLIDDLNNKVNVGDYIQFDLRYALLDHNHDGRYALIIHTHEIADVLGLSDVLNTKSDIGHLNKISEIFTDVTRAPNTPDVGIAPSLTDVLGTFATEDELNTVKTALEAEILNKAERTHLNAISEIYTSVDRTGPEDLGTAPSLADVLGTFASASDLATFETAVNAQLLTFATVQQLTDGLNTKVGPDATWTIGQVINLQQALDAKADANGNVVVSVNGKIGPDVVLIADDIDDSTSMKKFMTRPAFQQFFDSAISSASINVLDDVQTEYTDEHGQKIVPLDNQVLTWADAIGQWVPSTVAVNVTSVNQQLGDVVLTTTDIDEGPGDNPPNKYWTIARNIEWIQKSSFKDSFSDIDRHLGPLPLDVLQWDGAQWTNAVLPEAPVRLVCGYTSDDFAPSGNIALTTSDISEGDNAYWTTKRFNDAFEAKLLTNLHDVAGGAKPGQYLKWFQSVDENGNPTGVGNWGPAPAPGAPVTSVNGHTGAVVLTAADFDSNSGFYNTGDFTTDFNNAFPGKFAAEKIGDLSDVHVSGATDGDFLAYSLSAKAWILGVPPTGLVTSVAGKVGDVLLAVGDIAEPKTPTNDSLIFFSQTRYNNAFKASSVGDLADVKLTNPISNDVMLYDGTKWYNTPVPSAPVLKVAGRTGVIVLSTDDVSEGSNLYWTATRFTNQFTNTNLESLFNVSGGAKPNQYLRWIAPTDPVSGAPTGGQGYWTPHYLGGGATPGQFLMWQQSTDPDTGKLVGLGDWVPATPPGAPVSSVAGRTGAIVLTTTDVAEGGSNLYFTQARVQTALGNISIDALSDVTINQSTIQTGQVIKWNGIQWVNDTVSVSSAGVIAALGYTPANRAGDSFTGAINSTSIITGTQLKSTIAQGTAPLGVVSTTLVPNLNAQYLNSQLSTYYSDTYMTFALSDETTTPTVGVGKITFRAPYAITLTQIPRLSLSTTGSNLSSVDIKLAGTTVLGSAKLTVDASEKTSTTAATPTTLAITAVPDDGEITVDITSVGVGALGFKVTIYFRKT